MSLMPFSGPSSFDRCRYLTDTNIGPADLYNLVLLYRTDWPAIDALCDHAEGSFRLLTGLCAAKEYAAVYLKVAYELDRDELIDRISPCVETQVRYATEAELLEGLNTARTVFAGGSSPTFRTALVYVSELFAELAPVGSLTDRVVAEMTVRKTYSLCPELWLETRFATSRYHSAAAESDRLASRYLLTKFGKHVPSWDMFCQIHTSAARTGDVVDLVLATEQADRPE